MFLENVNVVKEVPYSENVLILAEDIWRLEKTLEAEIDPGNTMEKLVLAQKIAPEIEQQVAGKCVNLSSKELHQLYVQLQKLEVTGSDNELFTTQAVHHLPDPNEEGFHYTLNGGAIGFAQKFNWLKKMYTNK